MNFNPEYAIDTLKIGGDGASEGRVGLFGATSLP